MPEHKKHVFRPLPALAALTVCLVLILSACGAARYKIDMDGLDFMYEGVKNRGYRPGEEVTVYFPLVATDTDYFFYLDGDPVNFHYDERKGFVIQFIMPEHDVLLECTSVNSMIYVP